MEGPFPTFRGAWARLPVLAAALVCAACAPYQPQHRDPVALAQAIQARTLDDPALREHVARALGHAPPPWDLPALQEAASFLSPQLEVARARREAAAQAVRPATQGAIPSLNAPLEYRTNAKPGEAASTFGLALDVPIDLGHKRGARQAKAEQLAAAAAWDAKAAEAAVRARLRDQLLAYWSAARQAHLLDDALAGQLQWVSLVEQRLRLGAVPASDLHRAQVELAQAHQRMLEAQRQAAESLAAASSTLGVPVGALAPRALQLDAFTATRKTQVPAIAAETLARRPDVQAALSRYEVAQAELQLAVANQYPDIRIGPGYTWDAGAHKVALSLTELPLTLLRDNTGLIQEATARRHTAGTELQQTVADALASAEQALAGWRAASPALDAAQAKLSVQQRLLDSARRQFDAGAIDSGELLHARLQMTAACIDHEAALLQLQKTLGALALALPAKEATP